MFTRKYAYEYEKLKKKKKKLIESQKVKLIVYQHMKLKGLSSYLV